MLTLSECNVVVHFDGGGPIHTLGAHPIHIIIFVGGCKAA